MTRKSVALLVWLGGVGVLAGCQAAHGLSTKSVVGVLTPACEPINTPNDACANIRTWRFISSDELTAYVMVHNSGGRDAELALELRFANGDKGTLKMVVPPWQDVPIHANFGPAAGPQSNWTYKIVSARFI